MLDKILKWFEQPNDPEQSSITLELASAALMIEVMAADHHWDDLEESAITSLLKSSLGLDEDAVKELILDAKEHHKDSHDLHSLTSQINKHYEEEQKYALVLNLWKVAFADGHIDRYEDHMIRKISELIYLPHSQFMRAKHQAKP